MWLEGKDKFYNINPRRDRAHHRVANKKNLILSEFLQPIWITRFCIRADLESRVGGWNCPLTRFCEDRSMTKNLWRWLALAPAIDAVILASNQLVQYSVQGNFLEVDLAGMLACSAIRGVRQSPDDSTKNGASPSSMPRLFAALWPNGSTTVSMPSKTIGSRVRVS